MSSLHTTTGLARSRSLRAGSKPPLPGTQPSTTANPGGTTAQTQIPSSTSHVSLFLTNLRLLDLDLEPDWPDITPSTFAVKDAGGGQKKRIHCVEWALFQLFMLWDQNEALNKLKPFYPPLDQVQSVNLHAALLRGLENVKRHGVLGRDAIIRKTMLDECKGERFEEVLAVFSSAVLKKLVTERSLNAGPEFRHVIAERVATQNWGYTGDRTQLHGLILAHKASLCSSLRQKEEARSRYRDFEELLALKERTIARRLEQVQEKPRAAGGQKPSDKVITEIRNTLRSTWTGNEQWVDTLLYDDTGSRRDGFLATPFDEIWNGAENGRLTELEEQAPGLLEQLEERVQTQRSRLKHWEGFRRKLLGSSATHSPNKAKKAKAGQRTVEFGFHAHRDIQATAVPAPSGNPASPSTDHQNILSAMVAELEAVGKPQIPDFSNLVLKKRGSYDAASALAVHQSAAEPISDMSEWEDEPEPQPREVKKSVVAVKTEPEKATTENAKATSRSRSPKKRQALRRAANSESSRDQKPFSDRSHEAVIADVASLQPSSDTRPEDDGQVHQDAEVSDLEQAEQATLHHATSNSSEALLPRSDPTIHGEHAADTNHRDTPPQRPISPTQAMADQILASMSNASPSPIKKPRHTLSLADRTRMSMSRAAFVEPEDESELSIIPHVHVSNGDLSPVKTPVEVAADDDGGDDLVARTRRSMAGFEAAKAKAQLDRRRSQRKSRAPARKESYFPKVEEEGAGGDTSVLDNLIEEGADDMEAVFKSRPRMRTSPAPSPNRRWDEDDMET